MAGQPPSRALADALNGRSWVLVTQDRLAEAAEDGRRALAVAREVGYPDGQVLALAHLALAAAAAGEVDEAVRLAWQGDQVPGDIPPMITRDCRVALTEALIQAGDFAAAERVCAAALAWSRDAGDLLHLQDLLPRMMLLDLRAGHVQDAAAHLREAVQLAVRAGTRVPGYLDYCGHLCAATGRYAEAVTAWAAYAALLPTRDWPGDARHRQDPLGAARQALGPARARAAEERGAAMNQVTATEYAVLLTEDPGLRQVPAAPGPGGSAPGSGSWSPWSRRAAPTPRSPRSCSSASAQSARTWTGSATRLAAAAALT